MPDPENILGLTTADWRVLTGCLLLIAVICIGSALRIRNSADYLLGGRRMGRILLMFFAAGAGSSSDQPGSVVTATWRFGLAGLWWQFLWLPVTPVFWAVAPLLRRVRALTTADFFAVRFGPRTAVLYALYGIAIAVVSTAGILFSSGKLIHVLTNGMADRAAARLAWHVPTIDPDLALQPPSVDGQAAVSLRPVRGEELLMLSLSVVIVAAAFVGGVTATALTDALQCLLTVAVTCILLPLVFSRAGGFGNLHKAAGLKSAMFDFVASTGATGLPGHEPFTPFCLSMLALAALSGLIVQPQIMTICGSARTEFDSRIGFMMGNLLKRSLAVVWTFTGLACVAWYLSNSSPLLTSGDPLERELHGQLSRLARTSVIDLSDDDAVILRGADSGFADELFGRAARELFPDAGAGLPGLLLAAVMAAAISHCGTQLIVAGGLFSENIYRRHLAPDRSQGHYLRVARSGGIVVMGLALALQTTFVNLMDAMRLVIAIPAAIGISMWLGLVWTRWNTVSVWVTTLTTTATWIIVAYFPEEVLRTVPAVGDLMFMTAGDGVFMRESWQIACYLSVGTLSGALCALLTDSESPEQLDRFFGLLRSPVHSPETNRGPCTIPVECAHPEPAFSIAGFQFAKPGAVGVAGFVVSVAVVIALVWGTKWLSGVI